MIPMMRLANTVAMVKRPRSLIGQLLHFSVSETGPHGLRRGFSTAVTQPDQEERTAVLRGGPISQAYQNHVASGRIQKDADQMTVAAQLDELHQALEGHRPSLPTLSAITDIRPRNPLKRAQLACLQWMHSLRQPRAPRGLYLYGSVGVGKSYLMDLFYHNTVQSTSLSHRRAHFHEFMLDVHERVHAAKQETPRGDVLPTVALDLAQQARILCFDEFQVTDIADAMILQRLFGMLWKAGVVVVATSNRAPTNLYEGGINRSRFLPFIDMLQKRMQVVHMAGQQDYRRLKDEATHEDDTILKQYFFWPFDAAETRRALQNVFDTAAAGRTVQEESVPVPMGRTVQVARAASPNVAWLDFDELCFQPLGAADYLALCQRYPIVIVDHVPQLDANKFNEARRFVTFIDAVYETKTRLILATAVPVQQLFLHFDAQVETNDGDEEIAVQGLKESVVKGEGGSSSSHATTMIQDEQGRQVEWSATGRIGVSMAQLSAVRDVAFSFARAESRLAEMSRPSWGRQ